MKILKTICVILVSFFLINTEVMAGASNFEPTINMESDITENQIQILLGFKGEQVMALSQKISWDSTYLNLVDVYPLDSFVVTKGNIINDGKYRTVNLLADCDYVFNDVNYALLIFEVTNSFKVGKKTDVVYYTYEGAGHDMSRVRHKGLVQTLQRDSKSSMLYLVNNIDDKVKMKYWFMENYMLVVFGAVAIIAVITIIMFFPTKRRNESREKNITNQVKDDKLQKYDSTPPIKIDFDAIDKIGNEQKPVDMSEAITVSEYQPFNNTQREQPSSVQSFGEIVGQVNSSEMEQVSIDEIKVIPQSDDFTVQVDAFNMKADVDLPKLADNSENEIKNNNSHVDGPAINLQNNQQEELFTEIKDNPENLTLFQPTNFEKKDNGNDVEFLSIALLFMLLSVLLMPFNVIANESDEEVFDPSLYNVEGIRNCIVGLEPFSEEYDLNDDKKCDVVDIIYTKDLSLIYDSGDNAEPPGFADLNGGGSSIGIGEKRTTTKKGGTTRKTTTTKKGTTTTRKRTTTKSKGGRTTTVIKYTTDKVVDSKTYYTVGVKYNNAVPEETSKKVLKGSKGVFAFDVDYGYTYDSVSCTNGQQATFVRDANQLTVRSVSNNTVCTVKFVKRDDMTVKIKPTNAVQNLSYTLIGTYLESASIKIKNKPGYVYKSHSCSKVKATYDKTTFMFTVPSMNVDDNTCTIVFEPMPLKITIKDSKGNVLQIVDTVYHTTEKEYNILVGSKDYTKIKCKIGNTSKVIYLAAPTAVSGKYQYLMNYKVTGDASCVIS